MTRIIWAGGSLARESLLLAEAIAAGAIVVRRCVDAADLLASAGLEPSATVVLAASVARLDAEVVARILGPDRRVIGIAADERDAGVLAAWMVPTIIAADGDGALARALDQSGRGVWQARAAESASGLAHRAPLIAVWGPPGAPGRTCTALGVADELARRGTACVLVDADLAAPSLDVDLGALTATSGLLVAARQADRGLLTTALLQEHAKSVRPRLSLVTGLPSPHRSSDIRPSGMRGILDVARQSFAAVVVDLGACRLDDAMPKAVTQDHDAQDVSDVILDQASIVIAVARDTPLGVARLVRGWHAVAAPAVIALLARRHPREAIAALREGGLMLPVEHVPLEDRWAHAGRRAATIAEVAPRSRTRRAYRRLGERGMSA